MKKLTEIGRPGVLLLDCEIMKNEYLQKQHFTPRLSSELHSDVWLIVVIPSHLEESAELKKALVSLLNCLPPKGKIEVITVLNCSETADDKTKHFHKNQFIEMSTFSESISTSQMAFHFILETEMPRKFAGVGLARKIGMDEAVHRFSEIGKEDGVIVCFDADSTCAINYLVEIEKQFLHHPNAVAASICFEHPFEKENEPIVLYELHLRYFRQALKYAGHPHAYHTVGSSMAVRSAAYQAQNGMNKRKAGEDFYFLQKLIPYGEFLEINSTKVIPSPRTSDRVPFGTGRAMLEYETGRNLGLTYPLKAFEDMQIFLQMVAKEYAGKKEFSSEFMNVLPNGIRAFLMDQNFEDRVEDLLQYGTTEKTFSKRFFNWFNAFRAMKYIHYARDNYYGEGELEMVCSQLITNLTGRPGPVNTIELLMKYRDLDKGIV